MSKKLGIALDLLAIKDCSGSSTSSEIPEEERISMGLSDGLIRFSIGLDHDIKRTYQKMRECMVKVGILM